MSKLFLVNIDMNGNEIQNVVLQPLATAPANPTIGRIYYDTTDHLLKTYDGTNWSAAGAVLSVNNKTGVVTITKSDVGLGNVDNTSDATKKTNFTGSIADGNTGFVTGDAIYDALALKLDANKVGAANGVASLNSNGKIPESQIPASFDEIIFARYYNGNFYADDLATPLLTPRYNVLYVDYYDDGLDEYAGSKKLYAWNGSSYVELSATLALGETSTTAYRGDRGKTAYNHSQLTSGNPHHVSKSDVGLGNVDNKSEATIKSDFTGSIASGNTGFVTGDAVNTAISGVSGQIPTAYTSNPAMDGTASAGSSTSWAKGDHVHPTDTSRMAANLKGAANGVAELDSNGKVPSSQLPSYVDDVIEGYYYNSKFYKEAAHTTEIAGETGKIYVDLSTDKTYRWSGSAYAEISASLALGETSSTAYRGDRGKTAYDHSQLTSGNPHNVTKSDIGLGNVDNTSDATKKTNFKGTIASGSTGFVTGGDVYNLTHGFSYINIDSDTIEAPNTSVTITRQESFLYLRIIDTRAWLVAGSGNPEAVEVDTTMAWLENYEGISVTFTVANAPAANTVIQCEVVWGRALDSSMYN